MAGNNLTIELPYYNQINQIVTLTQTIIQNTLDKQKELINPLMDDLCNRIDLILDRLSKIYEFNTNDILCETLGDNPHSDNFISNSFKKLSQICKHIPPLTNADELSQFIRNLYTHLIISIFIAYMACDRIRKNEQSSSNTNTNTINIISHIKKLNTHISKVLHDIITKRSIVISS